MEEKCNIYTAMVNDVSLLIVLCYVCRNRHIQVLHKLNCKWGKEKEKRGNLKASYHKLEPFSIDLIPFFWKELKKYLVPVDEFSTMCTSHLYALFAIITCYLQLTLAWLAWVNHIKAAYVCTFLNTKREAHVACWKAFWAWSKGNNPIRNF